MTNNMLSLRDLPIPVLQSSLVSKVVVFDSFSGDDGSKSSQVQNSKQSDIPLYRLYRDEPKPLSTEDHRSVAHKFTIWAPKLAKDLSAKFNRHQQTHHARIVKMPHQSTHLLSASVTAWTRYSHWVASRSVASRSFEVDCILVPPLIYKPSQTSWPEQFNPGVHFFFMKSHGNSSWYNPMFHERALCQARGAPWSTMEQPGWRLWRQVGPEACFARLMWPSCRSWDRLIMGCLQNFQRVWCVLPQHGPETSLDIFRILDSKPPWDYIQTCDLESVNIYIILYNSVYTYIVTYIHITYVYIYN